MATASSAASCGGGTGRGGGAVTWQPAQEAELSTNKIKDQQLRRSSCVCVCAVMGVARPTQEVMGVARMWAWSGRMFVCLCQGVSVVCPVSTLGCTAGTSQEAGGVVMIRMVCRRGTEDVSIRPLSLSSPQGQSWT